jgi:hypothetical protein
VSSPGWLGGVPSCRSRARSPSVPAAASYQQQGCATALSPSLRGTTVCESTPAPKSAKSQWCFPLPASLPCCAICRLVSPVPEGDHRMTSPHCVRSLHRTPESGQLWRSRGQRARTSAVSTGFPLSSAMTRSQYPLRTDAQSVVITNTEAAMARLQYSRVAGVVQLRGRPPASRRRTPRLPGGPRLPPPGAARPSCGWHGRRSSTA